MSHLLVANVFTLPFPVLVFDITEVSLLSNVLQVFRQMLQLVVGGTACVSILEWTDLHVT